MSNIAKIDSSEYIRDLKMSGVWQYKSPSLDILPNISFWGKKIIQGWNDMGQS